MPLLAIVARSPHFEPKGVSRTTPVVGNELGDQFSIPITSLSASLPLAVGSAAGQLCTKSSLGLLSHWTVLSSFACDQPYYSWTRREPTFLCRS